MLRAKRLFVGAILVITSCLMIHSEGNAATLRVGQPNTSCPNAQYTTIGAAVKAAAPGVVDICPALYLEQLVITKPLTLRGVLVEVDDNDVTEVNTHTFSFPPPVEP